MDSGQFSKITPKMEQSFWREGLQYLRVTFITQQSFKQCFHFGNEAIDCRLGLFQDANFAGNLSVSKSTSGAVLCISGTHTPLFQHHGFAKSKQWHLRVEQNLKFNRWMQGCVW